MPVLDEEEISDLVDVVLCADDVTLDTREWLKESAIFSGAGIKSLQRQMCSEPFMASWIRITQPNRRLPTYHADGYGLAFEIEGQRFSFSYRELADRIDRLILQGIYPFSAEDSMLDDYAIPDEADEMNGAGKELEDMGGQPEPLDGEQTIADFLRLGSGVSGGKQKIYRAVLAMQSKKDRQVFIKQEYGWYSISSQGRRLEATPTNGIMIEYRTGEQHFRQQLHGQRWNVILWS